MGQRERTKLGRVLVLTPSLREIGGVQSYARQLIAGLNEVIGKDNVRVVEVEAPRGEHTGGTAAIPAWAKLRFAAGAVATAIGWRPDLVLCVHIGVAPVARLIRSLTMARYWLVLHGIEVWDALAPAKLRALREADRYISLSRFTLRAAAERHSLNPRNPIWLPPYLELRTPANLLGGNSVSHVVLTVGRLSASERYKGHDVMLEAWPGVVAHLSDASYWIVGDGDDRARLESKAAQLGVGESVKFLGSLTGEALRDCYARCDVFAMPAISEPFASPSRGEGFGLVYIEAMAHGKPMLAAKGGAPAEFIRDGEFGILVNPADANEVREALVTLLSDQQRSRAVGAAGREWVRSELTFEKFCERLSEALRVEPSTEN